MKNILLIIAEMLICYVCLTFLYKKYKKNGIYLYSIVSIIALHLMIIKKISILGINIPLGLANIITIIICSNILVQNYGKEAIKKYILLLLVTSISTYSIINLTTMIESNNSLNIINKAYNSIFTNTSLSYIALFISIIISILISSNLYYILKKIKNKIVISNIITIIITGFIASTIFVVIAYINEYQTLDLIMCVVIIDIITTIIGLIGTIPLYIVTELNNWEESHENS